MLIDIIIFAAVFLIGLIAGWCLHSDKKLKKTSFGQLVIRENENGEPYIFLEVNAGRLDDLKPGNYVELRVTHE